MNIFWNMKPLTFGTLLAHEGLWSWSNIFAPPTFERFITICASVAILTHIRVIHRLFSAFCARKLSAPAPAHTPTPPRGSLAMAQFTSQEEAQHQGSKEPHEDRITEINWEITLIVWMKFDTNDNKSNQDYSCKNKLHSLCLGAVSLLYNHFFGCFTPLGG